MHHALRWLLCTAAFVAAPASAQDGDGGPREIDACGVLVQAGNCVLFDGAGGRWFLSDYGGFRAGDLVRVVGTADPTCITICAEADGCVRGAVVYNPAVLPCGTPLPSFPGDICAGVAAGLGGLALLGLSLAQRRGHCAGDKKPGACE